MEESVMLEGERVLGIEVEAIDKNALNLLKILNLIKKEIHTPNRNIKKPYKLIRLGAKDTKVENKEEHIGSRLDPTKEGHEFRGRRKLQEPREEPRDQKRPSAV